jgi:hypothetical protein
MSLSVCNRHHTDSSGDTSPAKMEIAAVVVEVGRHACIGKRGKSHEFSCLGSSICLCHAGLVGAEEEAVHVGDLDLGRQTSTSALNQAKHKF